MSRAFKIDRVPEDDGGRDQVQPAGSISLLLEAAVTDLAEAIEEHRPGQCVTGVALVQSRVHTPTQLDALQPVEDEERALDTSQLAQGDGQAVLAWVAAELAQHQRGRHRALLDRGG